MADDTSGAERAPRVVRETLRFGTITVVGGGCYGSYYLRQLHRAAAAGAATWNELVVVDRNPHCLVAPLCHSARTDCHPERTDCHPERTDCHPERTDCHPERTDCHPERSERSTPPENRLRLEVAPWT